jgi:hypothetical protein
MSRDHRLGPALVEFSSHPVAVEGFVPDQRIEGGAFDERLPRCH